MEAVDIDDSSKETESFFWELLLAESLLLKIFSIAAFDFTISFLILVGLTLVDLQSISSNQKTKLN